MVDGASLPSFTWKTKKSLEVVLPFSANSTFFETARFNIGFIPGIKAFTAAVLGGIGNIRGALLGGLLLGLLENWGATVLGGEWKDVFAFTVLVLVLLVRPTGLLGESLGRARA